MEELRSFGYICPQCGKAVLGSRSKFSLCAAAARIDCDCGADGLEVLTDGVKFRLWVPCGVCGGSHQAELSMEAVLEGRGVGLACPQTKDLCCYIGEEGEVMRQIEGLALRCEKSKADDGRAFTDDVIMYEFLSELKDIAARGGIACACGSKAYKLDIHRGAVTLSCTHCGGKLRLDAANDDDLDALCCHMTLTIPEAK